MQDVLNRLLAGLAVITGAVRAVVLLALLLMLASVALRTLGLAVPWRGAGPVELAYLAGAWWLLRG